MLGGEVQRGRHAAPIEGRCADVRKIVLFSGSSAVGKTATLLWAIPGLKRCGARPAACKIDCVSCEDEAAFAAAGVPAASGVSADICPDHYLVSNLPELWSWADGAGADVLLVETAGLCNRCSPATASMVAGCVVDATASCKAPSHLGPMLSQADFAVVTKVDMVSQAEREIVCRAIADVNPRAEVFAVDALAGYGVEALVRYLHAAPGVESYENDVLRHPMPAGVCSYCVGERRVGSAYQQGVVGKMTFSQTGGSEVGRG